MNTDDKKKLEILGRTIQCGCRLCVYNIDFEVLEVDDDYARMLRIPVEEKDCLLGKTMEDRVYPEDVRRIASEVYGFEKKGKEYECKYRMKTGDGDYIWVKDTGEIVNIDGRDCIRSVVVNIDMWEKMILQRDIINKNMPGGIVFLVIGKDNFYIREANQYYFELMGVSREEYIGTSGKYTFPEDLPGLREHLVTQAARRESVDYEFRSVREQDGNVCWYRLNGNYYETRDDGVEYLCMLTEITKRKAIYFELLKEKDRYRMAMENNTADLMFEYDIKDERFRLFGENNFAENTFLCIGSDTFIHYKILLFRNELIYKGDRKKIISFIRNERQRYDNIRMLTHNRDSGKRYYDNYEIYMNKIYENGKLVRVGGYIKKIMFKIIPLTMKQDLHQIFDEHILKEYSFILKIDVKTGSFTSHFIDEYDWDEYRGNRSYDSFLYWWCRNKVAPEEQKEISFFLSLQQMLRILHSGEPKGYRFCRVKGKDGNYTHMICYFAFFGSDVNTIIFTVRDVNAVRAEEHYQKRSDRKILKDVLSEAKEGMEARRTFLNYIVKELNPPIVTIKQLLNEKHTEQNHKHIRRCMEYVSEIIGSIEEYNQLQAPYSRPVNSVNLYDMCTQVCDEVRKISLGLDISIHEHITIPRDQSYFVHEFRFKEIIINLLGNGIKYAPKGTSINLYIQEKKLENEGVRICIKMEDEGPVINERYYERSTEFTNDSDLREKIIALGGMGYSISLTSKITGLLGGSIQFRKGIAHNNIVQINIPVFLSDLSGDVFGELVTGTNTEGREADLSGQGILLVERGSDQNKLIAPLLRVNGAMVYTATSGEEAEKLLNKFDSGLLSAILVDRELEDMDCYEFARRIKYTSNKNLRKIPIIEMLEGIQSNDVKMGLVSGINATISKPINLARLAVIMESLQGKM